MIRQLYLSAAICALVAGSAGAQTIGTVATSEPTIRGTPPGGGTRTLNLGSQLVQDEVVETDASGNAQLLFRDQTTLALGPNTTLILDEFVFNPNTGGGQMGLTLTEGVLRFIGGRLSENNAATITTPTATIGIRGSSGLVIHLNGETIAVFLAGDEMCVSSGSSSSCTSRTGGVVTENGYQGPVNPAFLQQVLEIIDLGSDIGFGTGGGVGDNIEILDDNFRDAAEANPSGLTFDFEILEDDFTAEDLFDALTDALPSGSMDDDDDDDSYPIPMGLGR